MPSIYQDITSVAGEDPVVLSIPADTGRLKAVSARPMVPVSGVNEAFFQIFLADATREPPTPKAALITGAIGASQFIGWDGDLPLETNDVIYCQLWSQKGQTFRVFVLTEL